MPVLLVLASAFCLFVQSVHAYDFFILVRSWEPTLCHFHKCDHSIANRFTIHGLWPQYNNGTWPQYCDHVPFSEAGIKDLLPDMNEHWPSMWSDNSKFWAHEWGRHGTCAESIFHDEHHFFSAVLGLHAEYDLMTMLSQVDMREDLVYDQKTLESEWSAVPGHKLLTHCQSNDLAELWMCFDRDLNLIDCPRNLARRCSRGVRLPSAPALSSQELLRTPVELTELEARLPAVSQAANLAAVLETE